MNQRAHTHLPSSLGVPRKARREACTLSKRVEDFAAENLLILGGFTGFYLLGKDEKITVKCRIRCEASLITFCTEIILQKHAVHVTIMGTGILFCFLIF
jgi:hypothetical protein